MKKLPYLAAFGAGYVLGARAGRGRYEQIATGARRLAGSPTVQAASSKAQGAVKDTAAAAASTVQEKVSDRLGHGGLN